MCAAQISFPFSAQAARGQVLKGFVTFLWASSLPSTHTLKFLHELAGLGCEHPQESWYPQD